MRRTELAAQIRAEAAAIRVDLFASDEECEQKAREKGRLLMLAAKIERAADG